MAGMIGSASRMPRLKPASVQGGDVGSSDWFAIDDYDLSWVAGSIRRSSPRSGNPDLSLDWVPAYAGTNGKADSRRNALAQKQNARLCGGRSYHSRFGIYACGCGSSPP